jgi:uncharacterized protein
MSKEIAQQIVDKIDTELQVFEKIRLHFYGGEPLLNFKAIETIVTRAYEKSSERYYFAITTNGTFLNKSIINILNKGNFLIILSIDGPKQIHDACRKTVTGKPTHAKIIRFLETIRRETNCIVRGSAVVHSEWSLSQAVTYLRSLDIDKIKSQIVRAPEGEPYSLSKMEKITYKNDLEKIGDQVIKDLEKGNIPMDDRFSSRVLQLLVGNSREYFCGAGLSTFGITPDGTILPCILLNKNSKIGHINDSTKKWLKNGKTWKSKLKRSQKCNNCNSLSLCGGGCPVFESICSDTECEFIKKNCDIAKRIFSHFATKKEDLLTLAGIAL